MKDWNIIRSIFSYIGANSKDFERYSDFLDEFEAKFGVIPRDRQDNADIPIEVFEVFSQIAKQILTESEWWNEYSIITPFSLEELSGLFEKNGFLQNTKM